jgi:hypothetical protein
MFITKHELIVELTYISLMETWWFTMRPDAIGPASWCTNVRNEFGQVLISVLSVGDGRNLCGMCAGLVRRYEQAGEPAPAHTFMSTETAAEGPAISRSTGRRYMFV